MSFLDSLNEANQAALAGNATPQQIALLQQVNQNYVSQGQAAPYPIVGASGGSSGGTGDGSTPGLAGIGGSPGTDPYVGPGSSTGTAPPPGANPATGGVPAGADPSKPYGSGAPVPGLPGTGGAGATGPYTPGSTDSSGGGGGSGSSSSQNQMTPDQALATAEGEFPWLSQLPGLQNQIVALMQEFGDNANAIMAKIRQTSQWKTYFAGIMNADGTMKMSESQYMDTIAQYKQAMQQYGRPAAEYNNNMDFAGLIENNVSPDEFKQRLDTYDQVQRLGGDVKAAFYVYAGMQLTDDQLYQAIVNPDDYTALTKEYNARLATNPPDYNTYIHRVAEVGLQQAAQSMSTYSPTTAAALQNADIMTGAGIVHALNTGSAYPTNPGGTAAAGLGNAVNPQPNGGPGYLDLNSLLHAFQNALIGGAATANGLVMPSQAQVEQFRAAGVSRSQALQAYSQIATNMNLYSGALSRAGLGSGFTQTGLENALLLNEAPFTDLLKRAQDYDKSLAAPEGGFDQQSSAGGTRIQERGLAPNLA